MTEEAKDWCSHNLPCARYQALEAENERLWDRIQVAADCIVAMMKECERYRAKARAALEARHD